MLVDMPSDSVAALVFVVITAAVIVLGLGVLFLLFVQLFSQRFQAIHVRLNERCNVTHVIKLPNSTW